MGVGAQTSTSPAQKDLMTGAEAAREEAICISPKH